MALKANFIGHDGFFSARLDAIRKIDVGSLELEVALNEGIFSKFFQVTWATICKSLRGLFEFGHDR